MQTFPFKQLVPNTLRTIGAPEFEDRGDGLSPRRLPAWTRPQVPATMDVMVRMPSGVRLEFSTDATRVGVEFLATNMVTPPRPRRPITFNLQCGDTLKAATSAAGNTIVLNPRQPGEFELKRGEVDTLWFDDLPAGDKHCEIWLPHNAMLELRSLKLDDGASIGPPPQETRPTWLHYGSSISHCMEAEQPAFTWPAVAARTAGASLRSLGFGGQCHLDQFVARTIRDAGADVITIKTGINIVNMDSMRERIFTPALHGFLDTIREGKPHTPIAVISPIFCPSAEDHPGPTIPNAQGKFVTHTGNEHLRNGCLTLKRIRELIAEVVDTRQAAGDRKLHYIDGLTLFGEADAPDLPDDLHPNPAGYIRMGERFAPKLAELTAK